MRDKIVRLKFGKTNVNESRFAGVLRDEIEFIEKLNAFRVIL